MRPEDVHVESNDAHQGFPCRIQNFHYRGSFYELDIDLSNTYIKAIKDKNIFLKEVWEKNQPAFIHFKQYKIFDASEGHREIREKLRQLGYIE